MSGSTWNDFFAMGGFAFYVWGAYAVTLVLMLTEPALLALGKRDALARLRDGGTAAPDR